MRLGGESDPRNKALMKMFNLINIGERAGSGVPNIFNVWADEGWEEPVIEERFDPDRTVLSLSFLKKVSEKSDSKKVTVKVEENTQDNTEVIGGVLWGNTNHLLQLQMRYWRMYHLFQRRLVVFRLSVIWNRNRI